MLQLIPAFIATFFLSLNFGVLLYVNSTFLGGFFSGNAVSVIFLAASALNIALFIFVPKLLGKLGKERLFFLFVLITALGGLGLTLAGTGISAALAFIVYEGFIFMAYYCLDIFVEAESANTRTGEIRGIYYTLINAGIAGGPLLLAYISKNDDLGPAYLLAAVLLAVPVIFSLFLFFGRRAAPAAKIARTGLPLKLWWKRRNIRAVSLAKLALETFYGVMVIYAPLYLHGNLGFEWAEIGIIFTIMLLPFIVLEWPAGELADRFWGEKEMMSVGFFLMGLALLVMPFLGKAFLAWMLVLLVSRVGAALVEITTESYFFKKISADDTGLLAIFRVLRPAGVMFGAAIGALSANLFSVEKIFFVLALVVFFGMREALYLRDTL